MEWKLYCWLALMILKDGTANSSSSISIISTHALTFLPFGEIDISV